MELTREQRIRVNRCRVELANNMAKGVLNHCLKLFNSGMVYEAVEILADFTHEDENDCYRKLIAG